MSKNLVVENVNLDDVVNFYAEGEHHQLKVLSLINNAEILDGYAPFKLDGAAEWGGIGHLSSGGSEVKCYWADDMLIIELEDYLHIDDAHLL